MSGKGILLEKIIESGIQFFRGDLPGHQGSRSKIRRHQCLSDAPNRSAPEHRLDTVHDRFDLHSGLPGDFADWISLKSLNLVFGYRENPRVNRIRDCG
jgi:hypothetical protein